MKEGECQKKKKKPAVKVFPKSSLLKHCNFQVLFFFQWALWDFDVKKLTEADLDLTAAPVIGRRHQYQYFL